ncbi:MAG: hypothetical protein ACKPCQ_10895, partial [Dolichospermum sp.]
AFHFTYIKKAIALSKPYPKSDSYGALRYRTSFYLHQTAIPTERFAIALHSTYIKQRSHPNSLRKAIAL